MTLKAIGLSGFSAGFMLAVIALAYWVRFDAPIWWGL